MPRGSSWMMLIGGIVLLLGVVFAGWLSPSSSATRTLAPGESVGTEVSAEAGEYLKVGIIILDPRSGNRLTIRIDDPSGGQAQSGGGGFQTMTRLDLAEATGVYTAVIQNAGARAVTIEYSVTTTSVTELMTERMLTAWGVPLVLIGFFLVVGGLGLRLAWRGLRGYWES